MSERRDTGGRTGAGRAVVAGLLAGGTAGLVAAALTPPLRRIAGVGDRSLINGLSVVALAVAAWLVGGLLYAWLARRVSRPALAVVAIMAALAALIAVAIYAGVGPSPLTPYPTRFPSLAVPLLAIVALGGAAVFALGLRLAALLPAAAAAALVLGAAVGGVVYAADRQGTVHYTLTTTRAPVAPAATVGGSTAAPAAAKGGAPAIAVGTPVAAEASSGTSASTGALHFVVAPTSEASYTVNEKLASLPAPSNAIGKTSTISGDLWLTPTGLDATHPSTITVDLRTLKSDAAKRDNYLLTHAVESDTYPNAVYTIQKATGFPASYQQGTPVKITLDGVMAVHGQQQPLTWTGTASYSGTQLEGVMSTQFDMHDFSITPPSIGGFVQAQSGVKLDLHLFATQQPS